MPFDTDPLAFYRTNDIPITAEQLGVPVAFELHIAADVYFIGIANGEIKAYAIQGDVEEINRQLSTVTGQQQNLAALRFSLGQAPVEETAGRFPTFAATYGSHSNSRANGDHSLPLAGVALEEHSTIFDAEALGFAHGEYLTFYRDSKNSEILATARRFRVRVQQVPPSSECAPSCHSVKSAPCSSRSK
jgi:hypothetical protein